MTTLRLLAYVSVVSFTASIAGAQTWTTGISMPIARNLHGEVALDGNIYIIGGGNSSGPLKSVDIYNTRTNSWISGPSMNSARNYIAVIEAEGRIYAIGGQGIGGTVLNTIEIFDTSKNTWTYDTLMPTARAGASAVLLDGMIYGSCAMNIVLVIGSADISR